MVVVSFQLRWARRTSTGSQPVRHQGV